MVNVRASATLRLFVTTRGKPEPEVRWSKADGTLNERAQIEVTSSYTMLVIENVDRFDTGKYVLTLENLSGSKSAFINVRVLDSPSAPTNLGVKDVKRNSVSLSWEPPLIDGGAKISHYIQLSAPSESTGPVTVKDDVDPPTIILEDKFRQIDAEITGRPLPVVSWSKDGKEIEAKARCEITSTNFTTTLIVKDAIRRDSGQYVLTLHNVAGTRSVAINCKVLDRPGPASGPLTVSGLTAEKCTLSWGPPQENGGAEIMHYIVEKRETSRLAWTLVYGDMKATTCKVTKLLKGNEYIFRVRGVNKYGDGESLESEPTKATDPFTVPSAPTNVQVTSVTSEAMTICWERPVSDGGSSIAGYVIEKREKTGLRWCRVNKKPVYDLRVKASHLREGCEYEYRVFAENTAGLSAPSTPCPLTRAEDPQFLPSPPAKPRIIDSTKTTVTLSWNKPLFDGGAPVTGYRVEYRKTLDDEWIVGVQNTKNTEFTVVGLSPGTEYVFVVKSINKIGVSEPSPESDKQVAKEREEEPTFDVSNEMRKTLIVKDGSSFTMKVPFKGKPIPSVTWAKPDVDLRVRAVIDTTDTFTSITLEKATRNDSGKYTVTLSNVSGTSSLTLTVRVLDSPGPPSHIEVKEVTKTSATITWDTPEIEGGGPVKNYLIDYREASKKGWTRLTDTFFIPLKGPTWSKLDSELPIMADINTTDSFSTLTIENCTRYEAGKYTLSLENNSGRKSITFTVKVLDTPGPPGAITFKDITRGALTVMWDAPATDGGSRIHHYIVDKREASRLAWQEVSTKCSRQMIRVTGLEIGVPYLFRVIAVNHYGQGEPKEMTEPIIATEEPAPPKRLDVVDTTNSTASLVWLKPEHDGGSRIRGYIVEFRAKGTDHWVVSGETKSQKMLVEGLIENTEYDFRVKAKNDAGISEPQGTFSSVVIKEPCIEPTADLSSITNQLITCKTSNTFTIDVPISGRPAPKVTWKLEEMKLKETDRVSIKTSKERTILVVKDSKRSDSGKYYLTLENAAGVKTFTVTVVIVGRPSPPTGPVEISGISSESCTLSWSEPADDGGTDISNYIVEKRESGSANMKSYKTVTTECRKTLYRISGLEEGVYYFFRVLPENIYGVGEPCETAEAVLVCEVPSVPVKLEIVDVSKSSVTLHWEKPLHDGGSRLTGYIIEACKVGSDRWSAVATVKASVSQHTIQSLTENDQYLFRIRATNSRGASESTDIVTPVIIQEIKGKISKHKSSHHFCFY
uniref:Titin n=1 Tax=Maylandia zebra TaxID=106582 RepID=A0A3P9CQI4_9CICH